MRQSFVFLSVILALLLAVTVWLLTDDKTDGKKRQRGGAVSVRAVTIIPREFIDIVEALGTAKAQESVTLTARVSDTVKTVHFEDGQIVSKGDVLVELTNAEEKAQTAEAAANVLEAESQFKRIRDLVARGNASGATLDAQKRRLDETRSRLEASRARLADRIILAPFDGVLGLRQVSEGSLLSTSTPITTIDAIRQINLDFSVPERFIAALGAGQTVEARVDAYPGRKFDGSVRTIDSRVDPATRSILVRARVNNEDLMLRPGMLMTVAVISRRWQALSVPEEAVVPTAGKNYVFIIKDGQAERRTVTLGLRRPGYVEVTDGVFEGEKVVIEGTLRLGRQGMKVREVGKTPLPQQK